MTGHVPPHDSEAELALIGSILLEGGISNLREPIDISSRDFYAPGHRTLWEAIVALEAKGQPVDLVTLANELKRLGRLDDIGGMVYLIGLQDHGSTSAYAPHYARIVREKSLMRQLISSTGELTRACYDGQKPLEDLLTMASQIGTVDGLNRGAGVRSLGEAADQVMAEILNGTQPQGLDTGLSDLNKRINGLEGGRLYILAARPSMGKSALAMQMALAAAQQGSRVLAFSLEMPDVEITCRLLSQSAQVGLSTLTNARVGTNKLSEDAKTRVTAAHTALRQLPFSFSDRSGLTLDELTREVRREHARTPLGLVVIDYLQLLSVPELESNQTAKITRISQTLKRLARDLNIPILCLSQLNRDVEKRLGRRPLPSDLRDSGSIEQDADVIIFIYRDDYYDQASPDGGTAELIVAKQRGGPTGMVKVAFNGHFVKFQDLSYA